MPPPPTERLSFRAWTPDDLPLATAVWGDAAVMELVGGALSAEGVAKRLERELASEATLGAAYWPMFTRDGGEHVGVCGLGARGEPELRTVELGFLLRTPFHRRGLAAEAGRAAIDFAFDVLAMEHVFAGHHPDNESSGKVLVGLGLGYTHHERYAPTGRLHPSYRLSRGAPRTPGATAEGASVFARAIERAYEAFEARDADAAVATMSPGVVWQNAFEGGTARGRDSVRAYWARQWALIDPHVVPMSLRLEHDAVVVETHQVVRSLEGNVLADRTVLHVYRFEDGLIAEMTIRDDGAG